MELPEDALIFEGLEDIKNYISVANTDRPGYIPKQIVKIIDNPDGFEGPVGVGLGIDKRTKLPLAAIMIKPQGARDWTFMIANDVMVVIEAVENLGYSSPIVLAVSSTFLQLLTTVPFAKDFKIPKSMIDRIGLDNAPVIEKMPAPTNDSRELTTYHNMGVLKALKSIVDSKEQFLAASKAVLTLKSTLAIACKLPTEANPDVMYYMMMRLGEPTTDPTEAKLICMMAYQPDVLYNGVMYSNELPDKAKEGFKEYFNEMFN